MATYITPQAVRRYAGPIHHHANGGRYRYVDDAINIYNNIMIIRPFNVLYKRSQVFAIDKWYSCKFHYANKSHNRIWMVYIRVQFGAR